MPYVNVYKNFISEEYQKDILNLISSEDVEWMFSNYISNHPSGQVIGEKMAEHQYGFANNVFYERFGGVLNENLFKFFIPMLEAIEILEGKPIEKLFRFRLALTTNIGGLTGTLVNPHIDMHEPHKTFLYYVNDCDGETVFYEEKWSGIPIHTFNVSQRFTPKMGEAVIFDGFHYHSSSVPVNNIARYTINVNYIV